MKKKYLIIILLFQLNFVFGQITVYFSDKEGKAGYVTGLSGQRNQNEAYNDCINNGGKNPYQIISNDGPGYWSIALGRNSSGDTVIGVAAGHRSQQEADSAAKNQLSYRNATQNSIYIYRYGSVFPPKTQTDNNSNNSKQASWSNWKKINSSKCDLGIEYQTKREERYQLNYQLWFHYKVKNISNKNISFVFNLTKNGKIEFSQPHVLSPGGEDSFTHKMSSNNIDGVSVTKVINTETNKDICDKNSNNNSNNNSENSANSNLQEALVEFNQLLPEVPDGDTKTNIYNNTKKVLDGNGSEQGKLNVVNDAIKKFKNLISQTNANNNNLDLQNKQLEAKKQAEEEAKKAEEERLQKEAEAKKAQFDDAIQNGDNALNNKQYDSALSYYSQAKGYAQNASETSIAESKYNQAYEAKRNAAREERLAKQAKSDELEDQAYIGMSAGAIGIMALLNDQYVHKTFSGKIQVGMGYEQLPMITNQNNDYAPKASYSDNSSYPTFHFGLRLEFLNNKMVNINSRAYYSLGFNPFSEGISGTYSETGLEVGVQFWYKKHTKFKLFADIGSYNRSGNKTADLDAINAGTTTTDDVREGEYSYSILRYGGGPMFHLRNDGRETWIKLGYYFENISFAKDVKPTKSLMLSANIESELIVEFAYSKNYPVAGKINYPSSFTNENQNYFTIKLIRQGKLW